MDSLKKGKVVFNISPSALNLYYTSPLVFYFSKILNLPEDTEVCGVYGEGGNAVHETLEFYNLIRVRNITKKNNKERALKYFSENWDKRKLSKLPSMNGNPLSKELYKIATERGIKLLDEKYHICEAEEEILLPLIDDDRAFIQIKGFIDIKVFDKEEIQIVDWKTSSKIDKDNTKFKRQMLHYCYMIFKKHNKIVKKCTIEYLKIDKQLTFKFSREEIIDYGDYLIEFAEKIILKGLDKREYDLGDIHYVWNAHKVKCMKECDSRLKGKEIDVTIKDNKILFTNNFPEKLKKAMRIKYTYQIDGYQFTPAYKNRGWDGKKTLYKKNSLPLAYLNNFNNLLNEYNEYYNENYFLNIEDLRNKRILNNRYTTSFKNNDFTLRKYQEETINVAINEKVGILALGCGAGKTIISTELIKRLNLRSLFLVNRKELLTQTADVLEAYLGVKVGRMVEGDLDILNQITVASVQTIVAILKRNDASTKKLKTYLFNVQVAIFDEAQNVSDSGTYGKIADQLKNIQYSFGLTGTAWRTKNDTLEMNALCGFPIYQKTTAELEEEGYLVPTSCYFVKTPRVLFDDEGDYHKVYDEYITKNDKRNNLIKEIVNKNRDKKILVLTRIVEHGEILQGIIDNSFLINGRIKNTCRADLFEKFKNDPDSVLIGSTKIFSCGINVPDLDIIINATGHKSSIDTIQIVGRVKRKSPGKTIGYYIDFLDEPDTFKSASNKRIKDLSLHGNKVFKFLSLGGLNIPAKHQT